MAVVIKDMSGTDRLESFKKFVSEGSNVHFPNDITSAQNTVIDFFLGGFSAVMAVHFTNPVDLIKTRQQLQGELVKRGMEAPNPYSTLMKSAKTIIKHEGLLGLQRGLVSAVGFQFIMNSTRLGLYETGDKYGILRDKNDNLIPAVSILWGGVSGLVGSALGCPFYMVKTQLQSKAPGKLAVGYQHGHRGTLDAFQTAWKSNGIRGLFHGMSGMVTRTAVGSAVQLSTFSSCKEFLLQFDSLKDSFYATTFCASMISGVFLSIFMTPFDVVCTRMMNQSRDASGRTTQYSSVINCFVKTMRTEGFFGLYKGFAANYWRAAPHTVLNLTFWEILKKYNKSS